MSLFIGQLAFPGNSQAAELLREEAKMGILTGSILSALTGFAILRFAPSHRRQVEIEALEAAEIARDGDVASIEKRA
jgi:NhaA family Na+:H+ antiporter